MFKKIRDYKIIILKDNDFNIRELNIYKIFGLFVFLSVFFFSFIIISIYSKDIKKII